MNAHALNSKNVFRNVSAQFIMQLQTAISPQPQGGIIVEIHINCPERKHNRLKRSSLSLVFIQHYLMKMSLCLNSDYKHLLRGAEVRYYAKVLTGKKPNPAHMKTLETDNIYTISIG